VRRTAALAKPAKVKSEHIDSGRSQLQRQTIPDFAFMIALMQK
jgi:hypothetical protein